MLRFLRYALLLTAVLLIASGCSTPAPLAVNAIDAPQVISSLRYTDNNGFKVGPIYEVSFTVPAEWIGDFQARTYPNRIVVEYTANGQITPIFYIEALSEVEYWEQVGSYPGDFTNIANKIDTYFVYTVTRDTSPNGISSEDFADVVAAIPDVMATFESVPTS